MDPLHTPSPSPLQPSLGGSPRCAAPRPPATPEPSHPSRWTHPPNHPQSSTRALPGATSLRHSGDVCGNRRGGLGSRRTFSSLVQTQSCSENHLFDTSSARIPPRVRVTTAGRMGKRRRAPATASASVSASASANVNASASARQSSPKSPWRR